MAYDFDGVSTQDEGNCVTLGCCAKLPPLVVEDKQHSTAEHLMRQIMHYDGEFRREEATAAVGSHAKH
jgi:hypothetical protein